MAFHLSLFKNPPSWISILSLPLLVLAWLKGHGFLSILLFSMVVILAINIFFTTSKQKPSIADKVMTNPHQQENASQTGGEIISASLLLPENNSISGKEKSQVEEDRGKIDEYLVQPPPAILSETDCHGRSSTSEDSEVDWPMQDKIFRSPDCSDESISDEESLIEIALPSGHYVGHKKEEEEDVVGGKQPSFYQQKKWPEFDVGAFFKQHGLMELLAEPNEVNEEENLIEIDLSIGSIKCPRKFEIEA